MSVTLQSLPSKYVANQFWQQIYPPHSMVSSFARSCRLKDLLLIFNPEVNPLIRPLSSAELPTFHLLTSRSSSEIPPHDDYWSVDSLRPKRAQTISHTRSVPIEVAILPEISSLESPYYPLSPLRKRFPQSPTRDKRLPQLPFLPYAPVLSFPRRNLPSCVDLCFRGPATFLDSTPSFFL